MHTNSIIATDASQDNGKEASTIVSDTRTWTCAGDGW